jgi:hypothetical protein
MSLFTNNFIIIPKDIQHSNSIKCYNYEVEQEVTLYCCCDCIMSRFTKKLLICERCKMFSQGLQSIALEARIYPNNNSRFYIGQYIFQMDPDSDFLKRFEKNHYYYLVGNKCINKMKEDFYNINIHFIPPNDLKGLNDLKDCYEWLNEWNSKDDVYIIYSQK